MQNLTLFIILLQIPFSFGMFPGSSGHHGFTPTNLYKEIPDPLPNNNVVKNTVAIYQLNEVVINDLELNVHNKELKNMLKGFIATPLGGYNGNYKIIQQDNQFRGALIYLNNELSKVENSIEIYNDYIQLETNLNMADSITQHKSLEKQLRKAKQIIVAAIWQIANKINH
ncbi:hypothetical protein ACQ4LE_008474 [Meloidogyne hapla]